MTYKIWSIKNYSIAGEKFINEEFIEFDDVDDLVDEIEYDNHYHFRTIKGKKHIFFGDIDGYKNNIEEYMEELFLFLNENYNIEKQEYFYTESTDKKKYNSYHFSIPSLNASTEKLCEIFQNFKKYKDDDKNFSYTENDKRQFVIDTTIYSNHWFRCPNQTKGNNSSNGVHIIKKGKMKNFIIDYIPKKSVNIDNFEYKNIQKKQPEEIKIKEIKKNIKESKKEEFVNKRMLVEMLDILLSEYYDSYELWRNVGFILKKLEKNTKENLYFIFDNFSKKSKKYNSVEVKKMYNSVDSYNITLNISSLYYYARLSNLEEYKKIMKKYHLQKNIEITEKYLAELVNKIAGEHFIYVNKDFYAFNTENNFWYHNRYELLKKFINDILYDFVKINLMDSIDDAQYLKSQLSYLKNLCCTNVGQQKICETYKNRFICSSNNDDIKFDMKYYLLGFKNGVYDLIKNEFRQYKYDDYMTMNTGYNYYTPNDDQIKEIEILMHKIETNQQKYKLLMQTLASGIIGKQFQRLFIFNGAGGNGKSTIVKFMEKALGEYFKTGNIQTLCEKRKQGCNTELANLNKKRFIVFNEPDPKDKIKNGIVKEITGETKINARQLFSNNDETYLHNTTVILCNKRIYLENEATEGESRRIIDFLFESKFLRPDRKDEIDNIKNFEANSKYENDDFLESHKMAFTYILIKEAILFLNNNEILDVPKEVIERSNEYIAKSFKYLEFLNLICEKTNDKKDFIKLHNLYNNLKTTELYLNSTRQEKKELSLKSMIEFFSSNQITSKFYFERKNINHKDYRNVLIGYKFIENNDTSDSEQ
jgi:hypothetical protein